MTEPARTILLGIAGSIVVLAIWAAPSLIALALGSPPTAWLLCLWPAAAGLLYPVYLVGKDVRRLLERLGRR